MKKESIIESALAVAGGAAWAFCFGVRGSAIASLIALVPLVLLLRGRHPFWSGWIYGISYWLFSIYWIVPTLEAFGGLASPVAVGLFLLLCLYLGSYYAVFAAVGSMLWKRRPGTVLWALPALWVALEVVRTYMISGFPWNLAAYAWTDLPGALDLSAWLGAYGISFLVLVVNVAVTLLAVRVHLRGAAATLAGVAALLVLAAVLASAPGSASEARVKLVQPNTPILQEWDSERVMVGYSRLIELSRQACEPGDLIVWPESAAWPFILGRDPLLDADLRRLNRAGCSLVLNSISKEGGRQFNSAFLLLADGTRQRYDKEHLVPFGEYVPLSRFLPFVRRLARAAGDFSPGAGGLLLEWRGQRLGTAICFEVVFPGEVARRVRHGATAIVTITNDGWYGETSAPWQHFRAARFRAAENGRPVLRAALTGISAVISPRGRVEQMLEVSREGVLETTVAGSSVLTFYSRFSWLVPALCWLLLAFAILRPAPEVSEGERR